MISPMMQRMEKKPVQWKNIELVIFDCDGVLTDGKIVYSGEVLEAKHFSAHDGIGMSLLHKAGIIPAVITGRTSKALTRRCEDLKIKYVLQGVKNKLAVTKKLLEDLKLQWFQVAYMGDDWNDIPVMQKAAVSGCPADAIEEICKLANYITSHKGGEGAARDFIDYILKQSGAYNKAVCLFLQEITDDQVSCTFVN